MNLPARPVAWLRRLGALLLCGALLLAQQQLRVHPLAHPLSHAHDAASAAQDAVHDEHEADSCALCLAIAALAALAPAGAAPTPLPPTPQLLTAARAEPARQRADVPLRHIRGPPAASAQPG